MESTEAKIPAKKCSRATCKKFSREGCPNHGETEFSSL